jgi:hypothetical protein
VQYLGIVLSEKSIAVSSEKVMTVQNFPTPKYVKDVTPIGVHLHSIEGWNRNSLIAKPLTKLTRKDQHFACGPNQQRFKSFKDKLCATPVLAFPGFSLPFLLTDASKAAFGVILSQLEKGRKGPLLKRIGRRAEPSSHTQPLRLKCSLWFGQPSNFVIFMVGSPMPERIARH